jgi:uncharacterized phage protein gp47/JayE
MPTAPQFNYFDGSGTTTDLTITTNLFGLILTGVVDSNIIDVQININGAGFTSDPSLVGLVVPNFTIPNLLSYPQGLQFEKGLNIIQVRAIDISGSVSSPSIASINVVSFNDLFSVPSQPTGINLERKAKSVDINWSDTISNGSFTGQSDSPVSGYNIYASTGPGGTGSGYLRINSSMIPASSPKTTVVTKNVIFSASISGVDIGNGENNLQVITNIIDPTTGAVLKRISQSEIPLVSTPLFSNDITMSGLYEQKNYTFSHDRTASVAFGILNSDVFSTVSDENPLYYVITSLIFDKTSGSFIESRYSQELSGGPLALDRTTRGINIRDRRQVTQDYIAEVQRAQPTLSLIPGSTIRELHIEPFANESQKMYFLMDFVHRSQSFTALLQIDDPGLTGKSIPVANSPYKQALRLSLSLEDDASVQTLVDAAFDSLAANYNVQRLGRRPAVVNQTFYTTSKPTKDLYIAQNAIIGSTNNGLAPRFRTQSQYTLPAASAQAFFNQETRRYEIKAQMVADTPGTSGNVPAGTLNSVISGASGFQTINEIAADFGRDIQSNLELAEDGMRALSSLDTGTEGGYRRTSISVPGVLETQIIKSGDQYMMRDYDDVRMKHIGGKVDIYIKGLSERTITETFAFQFSIAKNIRFDVIDPINLVFRARDSRLTVDNPISEMLYNPAQGLGLRNHSNLPTTPYDLTGVSILDYNTIRVNTSIPQPPTSLDDFVEGDYRFRSNNKFTAALQPIRRIVSVTGEISGPLDSTSGFTLFKLEDPLLTGDSTIATDYVEINQVGNIPNGQLIPINDEQHVMIGEFEEQLDSVGINIFTIVVYSQDRSHQFNGPSSTSPDYLVVGGSQTTPVRLIRTNASAIVSGSTVSVDYEHDENFKIDYVVNDVLQQVNVKVQQMRHITADVIIKQAVENPMEIEATVQLNPNADQATVDSEIRTSYTVLTDNKGIGGDIHVSDVISVIDNSNGVNFVVQPFSRMTLQDGAMRIRDGIPSNSVFLPSLSMFTNAVYILIQPLPFNTIDGGGPLNTFHGVFKDDLIMSGATILESIGTIVNNSFIIGASGASIPGYSDDATLSLTYTTPEDIANARLQLTANHIVVSLNSGSSPPDEPSLHTFSATYVVENDSGDKDIVISSVEYLTPGDLTLTFRRAQ